MEAGVEWIHVRGCDDCERTTVGLVNVYPRGVTGKGSVVGRIVEDLSDDIRMGRLKPGERLPSEKGLGEKFGAGRSSVREALQILGGQGLVTTRAGRGSFVADFSAPALEPMLPFWERRHEVSFAAVLEVRLAVEPQVAALAVRADEKGLKEVAATLDQMEEAIAADSLSGRVFADIAFHDRLFAAAGNPLHRSIYRGIEPLLFDIRRVGLRSRERAGKVLEAHTSIYDAVRSREPDRAAAAMWDHILAFPSDMEVDFDPEVLGLHPRRSTGKIAGDS